MLLPQFPMAFSSAQSLRAPEKEGGNMTPQFQFHFLFNETCIFPDFLTNAVVKLPEFESQLDLHL